MDEIKNQIDELKLMQQFPRYYLSKYFDELKAYVDTKFALRLDRKKRYLEIISIIESFEQDAYNKWKSKRINTYDNDIKLIEEKLNNIKSIEERLNDIELVEEKLNNNPNNLTNITKQIDELKYKIEKILFSNNINKNKIK